MAMANENSAAIQSFHSEPKALQLQIKDFVRQMLVDLSQGKLPSVSISKYQARRCFSEGLRSGIYEKSVCQEHLGLLGSSGARRLVVMLRVLGIIQQLLEHDKHASKRDIYYTDPSIFHDVTTIDQAIKDICIRFQCNRTSIHVGKGYPDVATRSFLRLLTDTLGLPVFGLVDGDPHGLDILLTYRFGSLMMAYDAEALATAEIYWLGVLLSDCETFGIPTNCLLPLNTRDKQKATAMLKRSYLKDFAPSWSNQVETMLQRGVKLEIEAIASISLSLLAECYLPSKIKNGAYL